MKKCTYCGKEYPDEATVCELDEEPLIDPNKPKPSFFKIDTTPTRESKKPKLPDEGLAKFCIIAGWAMAILPLFLPHDTGLKLRAAATGCMSLAWGHSQVAAAKKWRQKYGEPSTEELIEVKKSHSISWPIRILVALVILGIVFAAIIGVLTGAK